MLDADAGKTELRLAKLVGIFADEDDVAVEAEDPCRPGGILAGERDVYGAGDVGCGEVHCRASIEDDGSFGLKA